MKRLKNGSVHMELNATSKAKGYTMRSNINPELIPAIRKWNQDSAVAIRRAIQCGDCKTVLAEMRNVEGRKRTIREVCEHHDKIVYDATGNAIYWWDHKEKAMYTLER